MGNAGNLSDKDFSNMDALVDDLLEQVENGSLTKLRVRGVITHIMAALDQGNTQEARRWFEEGRKLVRQPPFTNQ